MKDKTKDHNPQQLTLSSTVQLSDVIGKKNRGGGISKSDCAGTGEQHLHILML